MNVIICFEPVFGMTFNLTEGNIRKSLYLYHLSNINYFHLNWNIHIEKNKSEKLVLVLISAKC